MLKLYGESRPAEVLAVEKAGEMSLSEHAAEDEFLVALLVGRNAVMAERAAPLFREGDALVALGVLHLVGKDGPIERLHGFRRDEGVGIEPAAQNKAVLAHAFALQLKA